MTTLQLMDHPYKLESTANPISPNVFCADPTGVEYEGRLYIYGTNDHQQYEAVGDEGKNSYEKIKSLVCFSTQDMVNWEYHGVINTAEIAPWIMNSWAPSIISRVEEDGLTHFYLYFSNSGCGVGVITATHPLGPWSDPLGKPLVYQNMPGLENCPAPFDPGACIDENGVGWLTFGGGVAASGGQVHTKVPKIVRLGKDLLSFDSALVSIDAPYFFEASELNCVDGTYIYSYSTDWQSRDKWEDVRHPDGTPVPPPGICSMGVMTSRTPLEPDSWTFRGGFFLNAGDSGMEWANNHTHFLTFKGTQYILHHTTHIQERMNTRGGFRCMCVDYLPCTAERFPVTKGTREGVRQIRHMDTHVRRSGAELFTCANVWYEPAGHGKMAVRSLCEGAWTYIHGARFEPAVNALMLRAKGHGRIELRLDQRDEAPVAVVNVDSQDDQEYRVALAKPLTDTHNLYFAFSHADLCLSAWQAE